MTRARRALIVLLLLATLPVSAQQKVDWQDLYRQAITHVQRREWKPAEDKLLAAIKAGPKSGRGVVRRSMDRDDYFPEFYLGVVYLNTNRVGAALVQFQLARKNDVNTRTGDFRQLDDQENRARSLLDAEGRKTDTERPNPSAQFKTLIDRAQRAVGERRFDDAEIVLRQARDLNVDNAATDELRQRVEVLRRSAEQTEKAAPPPAPTDAAPSPPVGKRPISVPPPGLPPPSTTVVTTPPAAGGVGGSSFAKGPPTPSETAGLATVPVFYATDREALKTGVLNYGMTRNPGGSLLLGRFDVSIPRDERHRTGKIERPTIWTFWREDPNQHFVIANRKQQTYDEFYDDIRSVVAKSERKEAFVFIHGFNVGFEAAVFRTAQVAYDLGFDGAPILYSWPSVAALTPTGYAMDVENNDWTVPHLRWFLEDVADKTGAARVHLIAHGVGNKALLKALDRIPRPTTARFAQVVLTAPDIDVDTFNQLADAVRRNSTRTTLYASSNDRALVASKHIHPYRRAGDASMGVVVVPGIDSVDVTAVETDFVDHSFYGENRSVISDMFLVITQGLMPSQRPKLRRVGTAPAQFWRFVP